MVVPALSFEPTATLSAVQDEHCTGVQLGAADPAASGNTARSAPCSSPGAHAAERAGNGRRA